MALGGRLQASGDVVKRSPRDPKLGIHSDFEPNSRVHIEKFYYYEGTFRHGGKSTKNCIPSLHWISHVGYLKKCFECHYPDLQKS